MFDMKKYMKEYNVRPEVKERNKKWFKEIRRSNWK